MDFNILPSLELQQKINLLEGALFQGQAFKPFKFETLSNLKLILIEQIPFLKKSERKNNLYFPDSDFLLSLFKLRIPLRFLAQYQANLFSLCLLVSEHELSEINRLLLGKLNPDKIKLAEENFKPLNYAIGFTGTPRNFLASNSGSLIQSLVGSLRDVNWQLLVISNSWQPEKIQKIAILLREQIEGAFIRYLQGEIQQKNRAAQHFVQLLEYNLRRFHKGMNSGIWQTGLIFLGSEPTAVKVGSGIICSVLNNDKALAVPMRAHPFDDNGVLLSLCNSLTKDELLSCFQLPDFELNGLTFKEVVFFDIDRFTIPQLHSSIEIGKILDNQRQPALPAKFSLFNLKKHTLVAGVTGSGKTNTIFQILIQSWNQQRIPFLIIEPAKAEYRSLLHFIPQLQVFTLGYEHPENSSPLRLNPFYFPEGVPLQTHIDHLKNVFFSGFVLYPPMPYVLEECLYRVYLDKGWNLITSKNSRGMSPEAYPTLDDIYNQIAPVVSRLGYEERLAKDIRAALETRINNLRMGAKGLMLNTRIKPDFEKLFNTPTVMELRFMGNEDEKAFLMALLFTFLYEYRENQFQNFEAPFHLLVIEEAHRLLRNTERNKRSEEANTRAQAIESFINMLAEIRAYNQGIIIADQVVTMLAPEVLKNTNFKIAHRLVTFDERETIGKAMLCNEKQREYLAQLEVGNAIIYQEGMDAPNLAKINLVAATGKPIQGNQQLPQNNTIKTNDLMSFLLGGQLGFTFIEFAESEAAKLMVSKILLNIFSHQPVIQIIVSFLESFHVLREKLGFSKELKYSYALNYLFEKELEHRGQFFHLPFETIKRLRKHLNEMAKHIEETEEVDQPLILKNAQSVQKIWFDGQRKESGPFAGCSFCHNPCIFQYEGRLLAINRNLDSDLIEALRGECEEIWMDIIKIARYRLDLVLNQTQVSQCPDILICYLNHKLYQLGFSSKRSFFIIKQIHKRCTS